MLRNIYYSLRSLRVSLPVVRPIYTSQCLFAEPLKKKKKIDPAIIKQREERRRKKIEKQIRRLEKNARQLKPVEELEVPIELFDQRNERKRNLTGLDLQELEKRALLVKAWARYKHKEKLATFQIIDKLLESQNLAIEELRIESEYLYQEAIQPNEFLLPLVLKGPVSTPSMDYKSPDGDYIQKAKKWDRNDVN